MPMPLSVTVKTRRTRPRAAGSAAAVNTTEPALVNFTALSHRFSSAARSRTRSPATIAGSSSPMAYCAFTFLLPARARSPCPTACASARGENGSLRSVSRVASALTASTISVDSAARCSAPLLTAFAHSRSRWRKSDEASNSASATMPVSGVRMSWAMPASAASMARGFGAGRARRTACFALCLALSFRHLPPDGRQCHAQPSPTSRRMSAGVTPLRAQFAQARGGR